MSIIIFVLPTGGKKKNPLKYYSTRDYMCCPIHAIMRANLVPRVLSYPSPAP